MQAVMIQHPSSMLTSTTDLTSLTGLNQFGIAQMRSTAGAMLTGYGLPPIKWRTQLSGLSVYTQPNSPTIAAGLAAAACPDSVLSDASGLLPHQITAHWATQPHSALSVYTAGSSFLGVGSSVALQHAGSTGSSNLGLKHVGSGHALPIHLGSGQHPVVLAPAAESAPRWQTSFVSKAAQKLMHADSMDSADEWLSAQATNNADVAQVLATVMR